MLTTVGVVIASIGGVIAAWAGGVRLYWEALDRAAAKRRAQREQAIQTYTVAEMRAVIDEQDRLRPPMRLPPSFDRGPPVVTMFGVFLALIGLLMIGIERDYVPPIAAGFAVIAVSLLVTGYFLIGRAIERSFSQADLRLRRGERALLGAVNLYWRAFDRASAKRRERREQARDADAHRPGM